VSNPYLDRKRPIGAAGRKAESRAARRLQAELTPASGATRSKGDMTLGRFLIEAKATQNKSIGVEYTWLSKIEVEALAVGKMPALLVQFLHRDGSELADGKWVMVPERVFREFVEDAQEEG